MMNEMTKRGIIVSVQGYSPGTNAELIKNAVSAGAIAIRTDKPVTLSAESRVPIIGLKKIKAVDMKKTAYLTPDIESIAKVRRWADYVAVDYRQINKDLPEVSRYCKGEGLKVIADIETFEDYENIRDMDFYYSFIATTMSVFRISFKPNLDLLAKILETESQVIGEGNFSSRADVAEAFRLGVHAVCIGTAVSDIWKLTKKYTSIPI